MWTHVVCIHKGHFLSSPHSVVSRPKLSCGGSRVWPARLHALHNCSVFTALWCDCSVINLFEYPDSSISNVLTALKWWMIMTLNRKLLEKQRVQNPLCFLWCTHRSLFIQCQYYCLYSDFKIFLPDWQTNWQTNWQTDKTDFFAHAHTG